MPRPFAALASSGLAAVHTANRPRSTGFRRGRRIRDHLCAAALLFALVNHANAIVIRHDVDDAAYRLEGAAFPALVDLPCEGHGVLIAPQWVVTAAHAIDWQTEIRTITLNGSPRQVETLIFHPGYKPLPQALIDAALKSGDATAVADFLSTSDDIALIKLAVPVADVEPVAIFFDSALGKTIRIVGKGATGDGKTGHSPQGPNRTELRQAFNIVTQSIGRWISYEFDAPPAALALEGTAGNGDSGGPLLIKHRGKWHVAGLTSWKRADGNPTTTYPGKYGQPSYAVRLAHYRTWISATIAAHPAAPDGPSTLPQTSSQAEH